jgi:hypothetical protein
MIPLNIQIKSIIYSFIYGCIFSLLLNINYKYIYYSKGIKKILINIFFIIDNVLLYFLILRYINNGIFHFYFLLSIILGFIVVNYMTTKKIKLFKHWFFIF